MNWYAATDPNGVVQSFCSHDSQDYGNLPGGWKYQGPFDTQDEAVNHFYPIPEASVATSAAVLTVEQKVDLICQKLGIV